jgi:hypothetical protein
MEKSEAISELPRLMLLARLLRSAHYSDTDPEPKTRPNAVIRIFDLSLYYAELNRKGTIAEGELTQRNTLVGFPFQHLQ